MATYTVQTGDTISSIAKRFNVPKENVSGFRSNDANVIFPGETLEIRETAPPPSGAPQAASPSIDSLAAPQALPGQQPPVTQTTTPQVGGIPQATVLPTPPTPEGPVLTGDQTALIPTRTPAPGTPAQPTQPPAQPQVSASAQPGVPGAPEVPQVPTLEESLQRIREISPDAADRVEGILGTGVSPEVAIEQYNIDPASVEAGFQTNPFGTISSLIKQVMDFTGLADVRENINNISTELEDLENERDGKIREVEDNPWLSADSKNRSIQRIQNEYEDRIKNRQNRLTLLQDSYESAREEARFAATTAIGLYDSERQFQADQLENALDRAEKAAEATAKLNEPLSVAEAKALGVPFGTTAAEAYGITPRDTAAGVPGQLSDLASAIIQNPNLYNDLTASDKASIIPELNAAGFEFPRELSPSQQQSQVSAQSALLALSTLEDFIFDEDGSLDRTALAAAATGIGGTAAARREIVDVVSRIRTGAALTQSEENFYKRQVPNLTDTPETARQKLKQLTVFYAGIAGSPIVLSSPEGQLYEYGDMFDSKQRNEVRQLLSEGYDIASY